MLGDIPFSLPAKFAAGLADGSIIRIGTLIKDSATGRILAHVQESGLAQQLLGGSMPFTPVGAVMQIAQLGSTAAANVQIHQLKGMIENLQLLQYANIGISAAGLGVSVIGFVLINRKLKSLEVDISSLSEKMDRHIQASSDRYYRPHFSRLYTLFESTQQAALLPDPEREWLSIQKHFAEESRFFRDEIGHHLSEEKFNQDWFNKMTTALALSNSARIQCLLRANELPAAGSISAAIAQDYIELFAPISVSRLAHMMTANQIVPGKDELQAFRDNQKLADLMVAGLQEMTDCAETKPLLIENLISMQISGSNYLNALNNETQQSILLLEHQA
jgi:hypothetical protein